MNDSVAATRKSFSVLGISCLSTGQFAAGMAG
jgi:hypothetical protein